MMLTPPKLAALFYQKAAEFVFKSDSLFD